MERAPERARLVYHRSHLLYYRKHNGPLASALLRAWLAVPSAGRWLAAWTRRGPEAARARRRERDVLRLALFGR
jgi:hypothetical protein